MATRRSRSNWRATIIGVTQLESRSLLTILPTWGGQSPSADYVGPDAGTGPDGVYDDIIAVSGIDTTRQLQYFNITDSSFLSSGNQVGAWETKKADGSPWHPNGFAAAMLSYTAGQSVATIYINPYLYYKNLSNLTASNLGVRTQYSLAAGQQLAVTAVYSTDNSDSQTMTVGAAPNSKPTAGSLVAANPPQFVTGQVTASGWTQNSNSVAYPGWVNVTLTGVSSLIVGGLLLNDQAGQTWQNGSTFTGDNSAVAGIQGVNPLVFTPVNSNSIKISFPPTRDEQGSWMTLSVDYNNGAAPSIVQFSGQYSDPTLTAPTGNSNVYPTLHPTTTDTSGTSDLANLNAALASSDGIIVLGPAPGSNIGHYYLNNTLSITRPVTIEAQPGASITLSFKSQTTSTAWVDAIDIEANQVTLSGFNIDFAAGITWDTTRDTAIIGSLAPVTHYFSSPSGTSYIQQYWIGISLKNLNIVGPAAPPENQRALASMVHSQNRVGNPVAYRTGYDAQGQNIVTFLDPALPIAHFDSIVGGRISNNTLTGGGVQIGGGPWTINDNNFRGPVAGLVSQAAIDVKGISTPTPHDVVVKGNHAFEAANGTGNIGRLYRFFLISGSSDSTSFNDDVEDNDFGDGIGILPDDLNTYDLQQGETSYRAAPSYDNAPELNAIESYGYICEGRPLYVSGSNPRILVIPTPALSQKVLPGYVVSILSGSNSGNWRIVDQVLAVNSSNVVLLLDQPMPADPNPETGYVISVTPGHVNFGFKNNTIDLSGTFSIGLVLTGNNFGTRIVNNLFIGGDQMTIRGEPFAEGQAFDIRSTYTDTPNFATYAPSLGTVIDNNIIRNSLGGGLIDLVHVAATADRTYITASVTRNTWEWSSTFVTDGTPFLNAVPPTGSNDPAHLALRRYQYPSALNPDHANQGPIPGHPLLNTLTIGSLNFNVYNDHNVTTPTQNWAFDPSWTVGQVPNFTDSYGYFKGDAGFVDPLEVVVTLARNNFHILESTFHLPISNYTFPVNYDTPKTVIVAGIVNAIPYSGQVQYRTDIVPQDTGPLLSLAAGISGTIPQGFVSDSTYGVATNSAGTATATNSTTSHIDAAGVVDPDPQTIYQHGRDTGTSTQGVYFTYTIPGLVATAIYAVRLDFAEYLYSAIGQRKFDVAINGVTVLSNFDIRANAGAFNKAVTETFYATANSSGQITIRFTNEVGPAKVDGIEITSLGTPTAIMVGQDGSDRLGSALVPDPNNSNNNVPSPPDGYQDEHIVLENISPTQTISMITIKPVGGGGGAYYSATPMPAGTNGTVAILIRRPGSTTADLYFEAQRTDGGYSDPNHPTWRNEYDLTVTYSTPGASVYENIIGVFNDPSLTYIRPPQLVSVADDFDGDGKADLAVYGLIPNSTLYGFTIRNSSNGYSSSQATVYSNGTTGWGNASSIPVIGDYFGDGRPAYAIWYPENNGFMHFLAQSSLNNSDSMRHLSLTFGTTTDLPIVADVDGDGMDDFGVYGFDSALSYRYKFLLSSRHFDANQSLIYNNSGNGYGGANAIPVVGDFDGSGHAGLGVYIPTNTGGGTPTSTGGTFYYVNFANPLDPSFVTNNPAVTFYFARTFYLPNYVPFAINYSGGAKSDLAFYGQTSGYYAFDILTSLTDYDPSQDAFYNNNGAGFGYSAALPTMADYEGTGQADFSVYQPYQTTSEAYYFFNVGAGRLVGYVFTDTADIPANAPAWMLAKKVRGQTIYPTY